MKLSLNYSSHLILYLKCVIIMLQPLVVELRENFTISQDPKDIHIYLHPFPQNPDQVVDLLAWDDVPLNKINFRTKEKTIFLIPGFISNSKTHMPVSIRNEYLRSGLNYNIITVDWGRLSLPEPQPVTIPVILESFPLVVENIPLVSEAVTDYIEFLLSEDFCEIHQIHLIGHSLGGHVAGRVGYSIQKRLGQKLGRITGLDPSGPNFQHLLPDLILDREDATFTDVYHTNTGILGYLGRMGHVDFYPNGGRAQPGCFGESICSHNIAVEVFAVTINQVVNACKCGRFRDWGWVTSCPCDYSKPIVRAGEFIPTSTRGIYYYTTSPKIRLCQPFEFNC